MTIFSQYGETTTDVMAPGSTILSTYATGEAGAEGVADGPIYLGEEDEDAVLYESFDEETLVSGSSSAPVLSFYEPAGEGQSSMGGIVEGGKRFDGTSAWEIEYDPTADPSGLMAAASNVIDLSGVSEKPSHISVRYAADFAEGVQGAPSVYFFVKTVKTTDDDSEWSMLATHAQPGSSFGLGGGSWSGMSAALPENVDWEHFQIRLVFLISQFSMVGGVEQSGAAVPGTIVIDSIGLGSDLVPYTYMQGTSMASPAVAGAAAVIAGQGKAAVSDDPAASAQKLAALVKGAAEPSDGYSGLCSTGGYATVDGALNPGPAITEVSDEGDTVEISGYFMPKDSEVSLGSTPVDVASHEALPDGRSVLVVDKPQGFAGGQVVVRVEAGGKLASHRDDLGARLDVPSYDQVDLPVPDEMGSWGSWQLVGFNGDVYCLPRASLFDTAQTYGHMLRYRPDDKAWDEVAFPEGFVESLGLTGAVVDVSGATLGGDLVLQLADATDTTAYARYTADGAWQSLGHAFESGEVPLAGTLASDGEQAYIFGGYAVDESDNWTDSQAVYRIDFESGTLEQVGTLPVGRIRPQVAYGNGTFAVSGGVSLSYQVGAVAGIDVVAPQEGGLDEEAGEEIPAGWISGSSVDFSALVKETGQLSWTPGALDGGFAFAGPESDDGKGDTYLLDAASTSLQPTLYGKRVSSQWLLAPASTAYEGQFYVLAAVQNSPYRVFSATAVDTVAQPGDYVAPDPDPDPDPTPLPTPDPAVDSGTSSQTGTVIARTGDPIAIAAWAAGAAALAAGAVAAIAAGAARARRQRHR